MAVSSNYYSPATSLTITLASLANSGSVGRVSAYIDNTNTRYLSANVHVRLTVGDTAPTANTPFYVYLARSDNAGTFNDDGNGTANAAGTFINTPLAGVINCASTGTGVQYFGVFDTSPLGPLGPAWGVGIVNNCGGSLHVTAGSHSVSYIGVNGQVA